MGVVSSPNSHAFRIRNFVFMSESPTASGNPVPHRIGPYLIDRVIGFGGMGTVYLGKHEESEQVAAIKVLPASLSREDGFVARFQREIAALEKLKNPHVVELYESGVDDETYYYAMEYVEGKTLADRIRGDGRIDWRETIDIAIQVCSALKAAHDAGVIHRDLKPSNLMLADDGSVKLTDFGVAQVFAGTKLTKTGGVIGTVEYMSPEQAKGSRVTKSSDLYALGALMYAMLTARPPFTGQTALEIVQKHQYGQFDKPRRYVPEIPIWLDDLICQCLEKKPDDRPPDAFVLSKRLQEVRNKVELSQKDETIAVNTDRGSSSNATVVAGETRVTGATAAEGALDAGIGTVMRDAVRDELVRASQPGVIGRILDNTWVLIGLLVLLIAGGIWWWNSRTLTDDQKFEAGVALMEQPEGDDWIKARDDYFEPLLDSDAEAWEEQVRPYLDMIALYEFKRTYLSKRGLRKLKPPSSDSQRLLQTAAGYYQIGDFARAERILNALTTLTAGKDDQKDIRKLATDLLKELRSRRTQLLEKSKLLESNLARADRLAKNGKPDEARKIWQAIVDVWGEDPTAVDQVKRAREMLKR